MLVHSDLRSDELLSYRQGMGCGELGKKHNFCKKGCIYEKNNNEKGSETREASKKFSLAFAYIQV